MKSVLALGEVMIRLSTPPPATLTQSKQLDMFAGGAEANVLSNLAHWSVPTSLITKLPDNQLGDWVLQQLHINQIGTNLIQRGGERVGLYFQETGVGHRPSQVIYDRAFSSFQSLKIEASLLESIVHHTSWFHTSGITPSLNDSLLEMTLATIQIMKKHHIPVSFDVNYRRKLWSVQQAKSTLLRLLPYIDYLIVNEEDLGLMFDVQMQKTNVQKGTLNLDEYRTALSQLTKAFNLKGIAVTLRTSLSATHNLWQGLLQTDGKLSVSSQYDIQPIVDRIGSGDAFAAGLIYGLINKFDSHRVIDFATAAGVSKHYIQGDFNQASLTWIESLIKGEANGRILR
jgi:2-dehydro-3-deoxygluconokinase